MIRRLPLLSILAFALILPPPEANAQALGIDLSASPIEISCGTGGGSAVSIPQGSYILNVVAEASWFCVAATCASGGHLKEQGFSMLYKQTNSAAAQISCRSTGGTGKITLSKYFL